MTKKNEVRIIHETEEPEAPAKRTINTLEFLSVPYTDPELLRFAEAIARHTIEKEKQEEQFEVIKLDFKHKIESLDASIRDLTRKITKRAHYENVDCFYMLESPTEREKTLVRRDTGEVVRVVPMDPHDYQDPLPTVLASTDPVDKTDSFSLAAPANGKADQGRPQ
jgi:hypothetical protein